LLFSEANETMDIPKRIAETVNEFLKDVPQEFIVEQMELHYKVLGLMDSKGQWVHWYFNLESNEQYFLPRNNITFEDLVFLVDKMAENAEKNVYLMNALEVLQEGNYQKLKRKLKEEGNTVIVNSMTLAMVLEKLTTEMKENWRFLKVCNSIWLEYDNFPKLLAGSEGDPFSIKKALTIEETMRRGIQMLDTGDVPPSSFINSLILNIMEAVTQDENLENLDNAETGKILAKFVHTPEKDNRTGSGPCQISEKGLGCAPPLTLHWVDLYSTWNLAFVSTFPDFVYYLPKLLIPSVSDYQAYPQAYLGNRVLALYTFIHWKINWHFFNNEALDWHEETLTKDWGRANNLSKQDYVERLAAALGKTPEELESVPTPNFIFQVKQFIWDSIWLHLMRRNPYRVFH